MISDSAPWKNRLAVDATIIERWASKPRVTERRSHIIEQKVFFAAYAMRKLAEAEKLSSSFGDLTIPCLVYSLETGSKFGRQRIWPSDDHYDLTNSVKRTVGVPELLDTIVHSLLFVERLRQDGTVEGFHVNSDRRRTKLWIVHIEVFTGLMRRTAIDYPSQVRVVIDSATGKRTTWRGGAKEPPHVKAKFGKLKGR